MVKQDTSKAWSLAAGFGLSILSAIFAAPATLRVAAIQPGPNCNAEEELSRDFEQTREAAAAGARLVVWREFGVPFDLRSKRTEEFAMLSRETGVQLIVGFADTLPGGLRLNMAAVFSPEDGLIGCFGKDHPGTFAGDYSDVQLGYPVWKTTIGRLAAIICYDLDFTDTARRLAQNGAQIVAVPSNDSVAFLAATHYTHLVFRAIENRVSLIKADRMRGAAAVDPWGRVVARVVDRKGRRSTLIAELPLGTHDSPLVFLGDWIGWLCLGAFTLLLGLSASQRIWICWRRPGSLV
jgi:apolipoprotein N-acyltransferase